MITVKPVKATTRVRRPPVPIDHWNQDQGMRLSVKWPWIRRPPGNRDHMLKVPWAVVSDRCYCASTPMCLDQLLEPALCRFGRTSDRARFGYGRVPVSHRLHIRGLRRLPSSQLRCHPATGRRGLRRWYDAYWWSAVHHARAAEWRLGWRWLHRRLVLHMRETWVIFL